MTKQPQIPEKWQKSQKAIKATQMAFDLDQSVAQAVRVAAATNGLSPSDQIRKIIGLETKPPQRPRLTVSLTPDCFARLAQEMGTDNKTDIRRNILQALIEFKDGQGG